MTLTSLITIGAGLLSGFLLQRSQFVCYDRQIEALLFEDLTVFKFMLSAMITVMLGVQFLSSIGLISLTEDISILGNNVIGGLIFGAGWALLGYGPATAAGALGEGRLDAFGGILGMIVGPLLFFEVYPFTKLSIFTWGRLNEATFPAITGTNPWFWVVAMVLLSLIVCFFAERADL